MRTLRLLLVLCAVAALSGCAAILNPYDEHYYCRATDEGGRCMDVIGAYTEAVATDGDVEKRISPPKSAKGATAPPARVIGLNTETGPVGAPKAPSAPATGALVPAAPGTATGPGSETSARDEYLAARDAKLAALLRRPQAPVLAPPKLLRVLILPYKERGGDYDQLFMSRYTYLKVENADFVLSDSLPDAE